MHSHQVESSASVYQGRVFAVRRDIVTMPGQTTSQRDVVEHPGAVAVVALRGEPWEILLVTQYRHPVGRRLQELPAGLLDIDGERALTAAQRELAEEAGVEAGTWNVLTDSLASPGMSDEAIRVFLARDVRDCHRHVQEHEELELTAEWVPLAHAVEEVLAGRLENATAVIGILAAREAQRRGFSGLRPADAPWQARPTSAP